MDVTVPVLSRRAGGHRMPRVADWRRWVGAERYGVEVQPWRVVLITTVTALLIGGGTYAFAPLGGDDPGDVNAQVVDPPFVAPPSDLPAVIETPSETVTETESPVATTTPAPTRTKAPVKTDPPRRSTAPPTSRPTWSMPITAPITGTGLLVVGLGGRCLDVPEGRAEDDTPVQIFGCNGSPAQIWTLSADGSVQAVGKCLQIVDLSNENSRLKINTCNGRGSQQWVLDSGKLVNPATSRCLDVAGNNPEDRTPVITDPCDGGAGQSWSLRSRNRW